MAPSDAPLVATTLPLSLSQQEVWLDQRAWPDSTHLNIGGAGYIDGPFDLDLFRRALALLVAESEALRLVPRRDGGQTLLASYEPELRLVDVSAASQPLVAMRDWWQAWMAEPFALDERPPWRFALLRHSDTLHGLTIQFHHLVMDGWGTSHVMQRWAAIYNALAAGEPPPPTSDPGYRQFVAESLDYRASPSFDKDAAFWRDELPVLPEPLFERRHPAAANGRLPPAHVVTLPVPRAEYDRLALFAGELGATLFGYLIAVIAVYLARTGGRQEIVIGLPSLNRSGKRYRETCGMFVGVFPLVVRLEPGMTVRRLVDAVNAALKAALRHQRYPVSELGRQLGAIRQRRDSIFDVLFSYERQDYDLHFGAGRSFGARQIFSGLARYPLGITLCEFQASQDVELTLEVSPACFAPDEASYLGLRLAELMRAMAADPEAAIDALDLLPPDERRALLRDRPGPSSPDPYIVRFERQARQTPDAVAVVWDGGELDYAGLDAWAGQLAGRLVAAGGGREQIVALALERSPAMVAALLAIGKAGAAFLPLDPDAPLARLQAILDDSRAVLLLVPAGPAGRLAGLEIRQLAIDPLPAPGLPPSARPAAAQPGDLAYVLFTSGSTGRPKGVMLEHDALARRLAWLSRTYGVLPTDRAGQCTQLTFDPSLIELFLPLVNGASIALPPPGRLSPKALGAFVGRHAVTIMALVPSTLRGLLDSLPAEGSRLRVACCGGEVLPAELANRWCEATGARLLNVYGPTETAIFVTAWACAAQPAGATLPVGQAIDDSRIYILDPARRLLPFGVAGEVYIAGRVIARGYLNRPELDREAFFADPFFPGERMYRSGDRGWLTTDGTLHFVGRLDRQVKLRGYRIELGEIESVLRQLPEVGQAAAKLLETGGRRCIHAWVAGAPGLPVDRLRQHLAARLPDYMLPAGISCLAELPLNSTGKIAYDLLPEPEAGSTAKLERAPASDLERALLALWKVALKRDDIGVSDNFFDVGGDSLAAVDIMAGLETLLGRSVPFFTLIEQPTVAQLAASLEAGGQPTSDALLLRLGPGAGRVPIYFAASGHGDLVRFRRLAEALGDACDFHMLQPPADKPLASIAELASLYARQIAALGRPGIVAGFSVGGVAALETARLLRAEGFPVRRLCLVDVVYPGRILRSAVLWRFMGWLASKLHAGDLSMNGRHLGGLFSDAGLIAQIDAMSDYRPEPYAGPVSQIKSLGLLRWERWVFRPWRKILPDAVPDLLIPGLHGSIFEPAGIDALARCLRQVIDAP